MTLEGNGVARNSCNEFLGGIMEGYCEVCRMPVIRILQPCDECGRNMCDDCISLLAPDMCYSCGCEVKMKRWF